MPRIGVLGIGKVGLPLCFHLHAMGHSVIGYDVNARLIKSVNAGENPLPWEPGIRLDKLAELSGTLSFTDDIQQILACSLDAAIIVVPTGLEGDRLSSKIVLSSIEALVTGGFTSPIFVASTLDPRDANLVCATDQIIYTPVMIRLGHVIEDLQSAKYLLIGARESCPSVPEAVKVWNEDGHIRRMIAYDPVTIACIKLGINASLSMRIAWANDLYARAREFGAHPEAVVAGVTADPRIGTEYSRPGWPPGGPCLVRDMDVWSSVPGIGLSEGIMVAHKITQRKIIERAMAWIRKESPGRPKVLILGAAYNPGALDTTNSLGLEIFAECQRQGMYPTLHDPAATHLGLSAPSSELSLKQLLEAAADVVILCTDWPEYRGLENCGKPVLDLRR